MGIALLNWKVYKMAPKLHDPKIVNWNVKLNFIECPMIKHLIVSPNSLWRFLRRPVCEDFDAGLFVKYVDNS